MRTFRITGETRRTSGEVCAFDAAVSAPVRSGDLYACRLDWTSAGVVRNFTSPYSEVAFRRACAFVRRVLWRDEMCLVWGGRETDFGPPVFAGPEPFTAVAGSGNLPAFLFDLAEFEGFMPDRDGVVWPATIRIGPVYRLLDQPSSFACGCFFDWYGELGPLFGPSADEAYAWGFRLVRSLLRKRGEVLVDGDWRAIRLTAPLPGEQP